MSEALNVGVLLFLPYRAMETRVFEGLAAAGFADLTPAQARVFQRIAPDGSRLTDLAAQAAITKQSAGFLVDQLERERGDQDTGAEGHDAGDDPRRYADEPRDGGAEHQGEPAHQAPQPRLEPRRHEFSFTSYAYGSRYPTATSGTAP